MEQEKRTNVPRQESSSEDGFWTEGESALGWGGGDGNKTIGDYLSKHVQQIVLIKEEIRILKDKNNQQIKTQEEQFKAQMIRFEESVSELIRKITIGDLTKGFDSKTKLSQSASRGFLKWFYFILGIILVFGLLAVLTLMPAIPEGISFFQELKVICLRFLCLAPLYLPLIWAAFHFNRWAVQENRLVEEYEHKKVVVETYLGLANQVDELKQKGVTSAPDLLGKLLHEVVNVVCFDACIVLDKAKMITPLGEARKLIESICKTAVGNTKAE